MRLRGASLLPTRPRRKCPPSWSQTSGCSFAVQGSSEFPAACLARDDRRQATNSAIPGAGAGKRSTWRLPEGSHPTREALSAACQNAPTATPQEPSRHRSSGWTPSRSHRIVSRRIFRRPCRHNPAANRIPLFPRSKPPAACRGVIPATAEMPGYQR